jgi:NADPH-dependent ferric siderophore reductase
MPSAATVTRTFPLCTGLATVTAREPLTPLMVRFTLSAPDFADLGGEEPGEIITLGWSPPGEELILPEAGWRFRGREQHWRNFTVRAYRPEREEIDVDFFLHGDDGRASAWALRAAPGDRIGFAGPRTHWREHNGGADWSLLVADETGLPALLAILEALPTGHRATALVEVGDDAERQPVESAADVELHWLSRGGRAPGTTTVLMDALRDLALPDGRGRAWGGAETRAMRAVRDHLREQRGLARAAVQALGYWKHSATPEEMW